MAWKKLKNKVQSFWAKNIEKRIDFHTTVYRGMGREWITIDGIEIVSISESLRWWHGDIDSEKAKVPYVQLCLNDSLGRSLYDYCNLSIESMLQTNNIFIKSFAYLDKRMGKRKLKSINMNQAHPLEKIFYNIRMEVEGLTHNSINLQEEIKNLRPLPSKPKESIPEPDISASLSSAKQRHQILLAIRAVYRHQQVNSVPHIENIKHAFQSTNNPNRLLRQLEYINKYSKLLDSQLYLIGILELCLDTENHIRQTENWRPESHNADKQFSSLLRFLLADYEVPIFMDEAYLKADKIHQNWFKHIASGKNIRTARNLPITMTKKIAHHFLEAPFYYSINAALRWGQVHALGGDKRVCDALLDTKLVREFRDDHFWHSVLQFFIRNPMLDTVHYNPIIDYIWTQKYDDRIEFIEPGLAENVGPAQPNLTMRGRTVDSLLKQVDDWHRRLGNIVKSGSLKWRKSDIADFSYVEGSAEAKTMKIWRIEELLNSDQLISEGRQLYHCVASYAQSCYKRTTSIWTMTLKSEQDDTEKRLTIEVNNRHIIIQARGFRNRKPLPEEMVILRRWAMQSGLRIASWVDSRH